MLAYIQTTLRRNSGMILEFLTSNTLNYSCILLVLYSVYSIPFTLYESKSEFTLTTYVDQIPVRSTLRTAVDIMH
jgi:hypothetical protein